MYASSGGGSGCILLLEEDEAAARRLRSELELEGYTVECAADGLCGLERAREPDVDLLILELALPGLDGFRILRALRRGGSDIPAMVLSACCEETDKVLSLRSGADDFVTKPFGTAELLARVEAHLRRAGRLPRWRGDGGERRTGNAWLPGKGVVRRDRNGYRKRVSSVALAIPPIMATHTPPGAAPAPRTSGTPGTGSARALRPGLPAVISLGEVEVDTTTHVVTKGGEEVSLTPKEFALLLALVRRGGAVASRSELLDEVWGGRRPPTVRTVDTHVFELRRKLEGDPSNPRHFLTVRKVGYRLQA
jgi:two-component system, OmpR family, response regulator VicR